MTSRQLRAEPVFRNAVLSNTSATAPELIAQVQRMKSVLLPNSSIVYRAKNAVTEGSAETQVQRYQRIPSLLERFSAANPGSYTNLQADSDGRFLRAIVVCGPLVQSMPYNQQILGIDCAHSKNRHYNGQQMLIVGRDGNLNNITIAVALVNAEDVVNYSWFVECLRDAGLKLSDYPVFCDRSDAFRSVTTSYNLNVRYCTLHIIRNLLRLKSFSQANKNLVWELQESKWEELYEGRLVLIRNECGEEVETAPRRILPERWALYKAIGNQPLYSWRSTNFVESVNAKTLVQGLRHKDPYGFFDGVLEDMAKDLHKRQLNSKTWTAKGKKVTPAADKIYSSQLAEIGNYDVSMTIKGKQASVYRVGQSPPFRRTVDLEGNRCTCAFMDQHQIPCKHIIAVLSHLGRLDSTVFSRFGSCYMVSSYTKAFGTASVVIPATGELKRTSLLPAKRKEIKPGRMRVKRLPSAGEKRPIRAQKCTNCGLPSHNKKTSKNPPKEVTVAPCPAAVTTPPQQ